MGDLILTNAKMVLNDEILDGSLYAVKGNISAIDSGRSNNTDAIDCEGDYVIPGLIELHTDNLEKHFSPRPGVKWPRMPAVVAHDAQMAAAGITTVFDAVCLGDIVEDSDRVHRLNDMTDAIREGAETDVFRAEHRLHLRCELSFEGVVELFERLVDDPLVALVSLMDHTPGQRQFVDHVMYKRYYQKKWNMTDAELDAFAARQRAARERFSVPHRARLVERCRDRDLPVASHDDATVEHVDEAVRDGAVIAEFPTTLHAARAARGHGLKVLMGAPNLVLGGSHSGNISAMDLCKEDLLDIVSSDYVPSSLIQALFRIAEEKGICLSRAIALASSRPAEAAGLEDRGEIAAGKRADLVRVSMRGGYPMVTSAWRQGRRVV